MNKFFFYDFYYKNNYFFDDSVLLKIDFIIFVYMFVGECLMDFYIFNIG